MKERILASLEKLINQYGVKRFTIDDIAHDLKISKRTVYKYFDSKDALVSEFIRISVEDNLKSTNTAIAKESTITGKLSVALMSHHKYKLPLDILVDIEKHYPEDWERIEYQRRQKLLIVKQLIKTGVEEGQFRKDINIEVLSLILDKTTLAIFEYDFLIDNSLNINNAVKEIESILLHGILTKK